MSIHKFDHCTIFQGKSEVIVYGGESDWIVQYSRITNHADGWRRWFANRDDAEAKAKEIAGKEYKGRYGVSDKAAEPARFA